MKLILVLIIIAITPSFAFASVPSAYVIIANAHRVDPQVIYAIAKAESSRRRYPHPWPWTANIAGKPLYFSTRQALYQHLQSTLKSGKRNFDVGLMQVNWYHNSDLFNNDLWAATDPYQNIVAGTSHFKELLQKHKSYRTAIGLYHTGSTNTPARAARAKSYTRRVLSYLPSSNVDVS